MPPLALLVSSVHDGGGGGSRRTADDDDITTVSGAKAHGEKVCTVGRPVPGQASRMNNQGQKVRGRGMSCSSGVSTGMLQGPKTCLETDPFSP